MSADTLRMALVYANRLGWRVFPVGPDCRQPLCEHGCKSASADPDAIRRLWGPRDCNVALATGAGSGVFALDVDVKGPTSGLASLRALEQEHEPLPATPMSATPSSGRHIFLKQPDRQLRNRVAFRPGLDVRTSGGSVCLPPSRRADGAYKWLVTPADAPFAEAPGWLLDIIDPPPVDRPARQPLKLANLGRATRYVERAVDDECRRVAETAPGAGRNQALFKAAANLGELVAARLLPEAVAVSELASAAAACGLAAEDGEHSIRATIASGLKRGLLRPREVAL